MKPVTHVYVEEPLGKWQPQDMKELAELIQRTIEDFMHEEESDE